MIVMVGLLQRLLNRKNTLSALERENQELRQIIINLLPSSEKYLDLLIDGQAKDSQIKQLVKLTGPKAWAGVM